MSTRPDERRREIRVAAVLVLVLAAVGALAGLIWSAWSPDGPRALVVHPGVFIPDETESFVAADGRFLVIAASLGLAAAVVTWFLPRTRGVIVLLGLLVGTQVAALLTEVVGRLTGGGTYSGRTDTIIAELPLTVHAHGLYVIAPATAALVYGLLVSFAVHDDLGRGDDPPPAATPALVAAGHQPQDGRRDGDAAGPLQQGDLPPQ